ncbi:MAG TPA: type II toxin-antitoxin system VapC family toxin [Terriglobia bacterium]|nr:type II toxin-antitoxin system VapC family toxin [Terriglobia bacterium]
MILLDTHVPVWLAFEPLRVSVRARTAIEGARAKGEGLALCDISLLEISTLHRRGRIQLDAGLPSFLREMETRFTILSITSRACVAACDLPASYPKDPADRIIAGTALAEGLPLLTADSEIRRSKAVHTIW